MRNYSRNSNRSMQHLNGNLLCCIDCETTGLVPGVHDIWQVAVLPLNEDIEPIKDIMPFYIDIKIKNPGVVNKKAIQMNYSAWLDRQKLALDPFTAADLFDEWFQKLELPLYKKIVPLAQNYPFDRSFLIEWLGFETFDQLFFPHYRDLMTAALFVNDCTCFKSERIKYPKVNLQYLSNVLEVKNQKAHDALQDCLTTSECYRRLIMRTI